MTSSWRGFSNAHTHVPGYQRSRKISESALAREPAQLGFCCFLRSEICCFLLRLTWPRRCLAVSSESKSILLLLACLPFQLVIARSHSCRTCPNAPNRETKNASALLHPMPVQQQPSCKYQKPSSPFFLSSYQKLYLESGHVII
jgi:hypothetical protein